MNRETLIDLRNIFLGCFFIGFIFLVAAIALYMPCECAIANFYLQEIGIKLDTYFNFWVGFIGLVKMLLVFIFLVPALSLHLMVVLHPKQVSQE